MPAISDFGEYNSCSEFGIAVAEKMKELGISDGCAARMVYVERPDIRDQADAYLPWHLMRVEE